MSEIFRRFGLVRSILSLVIIFILFGGLFGASYLVGQSQETRKYASGGWCAVYNGEEKPQNLAGYVPCDTPGESLQGTYEQVSNIRENAAAVTDPGNAAQLQAVAQQIGNANVNNGTIDGGTHGGQENVSACSGNSCASATTGDGAETSGGANTSAGNTTVSGGGAAGGSGSNTPKGNGTTADNACTAQPDCGGPNQGYCTCGADGKSDPKGKPTCQGGYEVLGGDCVPIGTKERTGSAPASEGTHCSSDGDCGSGLFCSNHSCAPKPVETPATTPAERYGITDNICHLPGAGCKTDADWRNGFAAARGDIKALEQLEGVNATVFSQVTVDGGVVKTTLPNTSVSKQPPVGGAPISDEAQKRREAETQRCSKTLHLCPMLDPSSLQIVGWVPADQAVFGTFAEAGLARQNLSIGNLFETVELDGQKYQAYNFNWKNLSAEELAKINGLSDAKELQRIAQTAEQNKVTTDANNRIIIDQKYDLKKFEEQNKQFWNDQNNIQEKIVQSISNKDDPKVFQKYLDECRGDFNRPCNEQELWDHVKKSTYVELLPPESQKSIKEYVSSASQQYIAFLDKQKQAEITAEQKKQALSAALNAYVNTGDSQALLKLCAELTPEGECHSVRDALTVLVPSATSEIENERKLVAAKQEYFKTGKSGNLKIICQTKFGQYGSPCSSEESALRALDPENAENIINKVTEVAQENAARQAIATAAKNYIATGGDEAAIIQACEKLNPTSEHACDSVKYILTRYLDANISLEVITQANQVKRDEFVVNTYSNVLKYGMTCDPYSQTETKCKDKNYVRVSADEMEKYKKEFEQVLSPNNPAAILAIVDAYKANKLQNSDLLSACKKIQGQDSSISCDGDQTSVIASLLMVANPSNDPAVVNQYAGGVWLENKNQNLSLLEKTATTLQPLIPELQAGGPLGKYYTNLYNSIYSDGSFNASDLLTLGSVVIDPLGIGHTLTEQGHGIFDDQATSLFQGKTDFGTAALTVTGRSANALTFGAFSNYAAENVRLNDQYGSQNYLYGSQKYKDRVFNNQNFISAAKLGGIVAAEISGVGAVFAAPAYVPIALGAMNFSLSTSQAASACDNTQVNYSDAQCALMSANVVVATISLGASTYLGEAQLAYQAASNSLATAETAGSETAGALVAANAAKTQLGYATGANLASTVTEVGINGAFTVSSCSQGDVFGCGMSFASTLLTGARFKLQANETAGLLRGTVSSAEEIAAQQLANQQLAKAGNALATTQASITCGAVMVGAGGQEGLAQCGQALASLRTLGLEGGETPKTGGGGDVDAELIAAGGAANKLANSADTGPDKILITETEMNAIVESMAKNKANTTESLTSTLITNADTAIAQARGDLAELTTIKADKGSQKTSKAQLDVVAETVQTTTEAVRQNIADLRAAYDVAESMGDVVSMQKIREQLTTLSTIAKDLRATAAELAGNTTAPVTAKAVQSELGELSTLAGSATKLANAIEVAPTKTSTSPTDSMQVDVPKVSENDATLPEPVKPLSLQEAEQAAKTNLDRSTQEYQQAQQRYDELQTKVRDIESIDVLGKKSDELNVTIPQQVESVADSTAKLPQEFVAKHQDQVTQLNALAKQVNELEQYMQSGQITKEEFNKHLTVSEYKRALSDLNAALSKERATVLVQKRNVENSLGTLSNVEVVRNELQVAKTALEKSRSALASKEMEFDFAHQQRTDQEKLAARVSPDSSVSQEPDYSGLSLNEVRQRLGEVEQRIEEHARAIELSDSVVEDGGETAIIQNELNALKKDQAALIVQKEKIGSDKKQGLFADIREKINELGKNIFGSEDTPSAAGCAISSTFIQIVYAAGSPCGAFTIELGESQYIDGIGYIHKDDKGKITRIDVFGNQSTEVPRSGTYIDLNDGSFAEIKQTDLGIDIRPSKSEIELPSQLPEPQNAEDVMGEIFKESGVVPQNQKFIDFGWMQPGDGLFDVDVGKNKIDQFFEIFLPNEVPSILGEGKKIDSWKKVNTTDYLLTKGVDLSEASPSEVVSQLPSGTMLTNILDDAGTSPLTKYFIIQEGKLYKVERPIPDVSFIEQVQKVAQYETVRLTKINGDSFEKGGALYKPENTGYLSSDETYGNGLAVLDARILLERGFIFINDQTHEYVYRTPAGDFQTSIMREPVIPKEVGEQRKNIKAMIESGALETTQGKEDVERMQIRLKYEQLKRILAKMPETQQRETLSNFLSDQIATRISGINELGERISPPSPSEIPTHLDEIYADTHGQATEKILTARPEDPRFMITRDDPHTAYFIETVLQKTITKLYGEDGRAVLRFGQDPAYQEILARVRQETEIQMKSAQDKNEPVKPEFVIGVVDNALQSYLKEFGVESLGTAVIRPFLENNDRRMSPAQMVCAGKANCYQVASIKSRLMKDLSTPEYPIQSRVIVGVDTIPHAVAVTQVPSTITIVESKEGTVQFSSKTNSDKAVTFVHSYQYGSPEDPEGFWRSQSESIRTHNFGFGAYTRQNLGLER